MTKKTKTGKELERRVADAYREMGACKVEHDVELAGNQIDVYVELETPGRLRHRIVVEAKDWTSPVGINVVNGFVEIVNLLRHARLIDEGIIISASGFSRPARNAAKGYDIRLLELADLEVMAVETKAAKDAFEKLNEWKELHNLLQGLLISFGPFHRQVDLVYAGRGIMDLPSLETNLHPCDTQIAKLISFAATINCIGKRYEEARDGLRGERWVLDVVTAHRRIKAVLKEKGDSHVLSNLANEFDSICNAYLDYADKELRRTASRLRPV